MPTPTPELGLLKGVDADDTADYLVTSLANSLTTVDSLFNAVSGHTHSGAHQGAPVVPATGTVPGSAITDGSITNAKLGPDVARANLLVNGGFEQWQRGTGPFSNTYAADRWSAGAAGTDTLSVSKNTTTLDTGSTASAVCTFTLGTGAGASNVTQILRISDGNQFAGRTLSLSIRLNTSTASAVRVALISDGTGGANTNSGFHPGSGGWQTLSVTATIPVDATAVYARVSFAASCTAYIDNASLVVGSQPADYVPLHPADDLARCLRYYEKIGGSSGGVPQLYGYGAAGTQVSTTIGQHARKAVTPTITIVGTWFTTNCAAPGAVGDVDDVVLYTPTVTALGAFQLRTVDATTYITIEANP